MNKLDLSEAALSGAALATVQKILVPGIGTGTVLKNGGVMVGSELLAQYLMSPSDGALRKFLYSQHGDLTTAGIYTIVQELMRLVGAGGRGYNAEWREIFANLFLALGSQEVGSQINSALGMAPGSISAASVLQLQSPSVPSSDPVVSRSSKVISSRRVIM